VKEWEPGASSPGQSWVDPLVGLPSESFRTVESGNVSANSPERWEARGQIGVGGMGKVSIAYDRLLGREVAMKTPIGVADRQRLLREALVTARLDHPGIVAVYDAGNDADGVPWFAMRLVRGKSLLSLLGDATPSTRALLLRHLLAAFEAVGFAHSRGIVHRDLKPANILVGAYGETQVIDWGLALAPDLPSPDSGRAGTPSAMSPEQARGEAVDSRTDVYALGVILRHVVCGRPTFDEGDPEAILGALARSDIPPMQTENVAPELQAVIGRAMAPLPSERYPHAAALADDLARYLDGRRVSAHGYSALQHLRRLMSLWRVPLVILGSGLAVLLIVTAIFFSRVADEAERAEVSLALSLVHEARRALAHDLRGPAEIFARRAEAASPAEALGVLMALPKERASRVRIAELACTPNDVAMLEGGTVRVACHSPGQVEVWDDGVFRWGLSLASYAAVLLDRGRVLLVYRDAKQFDYYRADNGAFLRTGDAMSNRQRVEPGIDARWAVSYGEGAVQRVRAEGSDEVPKSYCVDSAVRVAAFTRDGMRWALLCTNGMVVVGEFAATSNDSEPIRAFAGRGFDTQFNNSAFGPMPSAIAFETPDSLLVGDDAGRLTRVDLAAFVPGTAGHKMLHAGGGLVRDIVVAPDAASAVIVLDGEQPGVIDLKRWASLGHIANSRSTSRGRVNFDGQGTFVLANTLVERWDYRSTEPRQFEFSHGVSALAISEDGRYLAASWNETAQLIEVESRQIVATHRWKGGFLKALALAHGAPATRVVAAVNNAVPGVFGFDLLAPTLPFFAEYNLRRVAVLADGSVLAANYTQQLIHRDVGRQERVLSGVVPVDLDVSPDGRWALVLANDHTLHRGLDLHAGGALVSYAIDIRATEGVIESDGTSWTVSPDAIRSWGPQGEERAGFALPGADLTTLAAAADLVAAASKDGSVYVWRKGTTEPWAIVRDHERRADTLVIDPHGRWIASGAWDGRLVFLRGPGEVAQSSVGEAEQHWGLSLQELLRSHR